MSLSELSIRRPVLAWMMMIALIVFGAISFFRMGISQLPDADFPMVDISLSLENAAPEVMESDVVDRVEDAIMGIEGIRNVASHSTQGSAHITVEFDLDQNVDTVLQAVQTRIAQVQKQLPHKLEPPAITKTNPEDQPILWIMLTSDQNIPVLNQMIYARNTLKNQFSTIKGVGSILLAGYVDPNLRVNLLREKLKQYSLTAQDIMSSIQNEQIEEPAGRIENSKKETNVRLLGEAATPQEFGAIRINQRGGAPNYLPLQLHHVATIEEGLSDIRAISRYNGKAAIGLGIVKQRGSNAVEVSKAVRAKIDQIRSGLPSGMTLNVQLDTTTFIRESVSELNFTLILAALLTSLICYLFLGSWSSTFNVLMAIPTSIIGAFIVLYFFGFTLNTFTLLGLSLAIGIVVDDAIMMLENIVRHAEGGKSRLQASLDGSREISFAALAATIAIAAIFLPVIFMKGVIGRYFFQYGITVTTAVLLSLLEALTLTPMRCSKMLQIHDESQKKNFLIRFVDQGMSSLSKSYQKILFFLLKKPGWTVLFSLSFFLLTLGFVKSLPRELIPQQDQSLFLVTLQAPVGASLAATNKDFLRAEQAIKEHSEVSDLYTTIGHYGGQDLVNTGQIYVILKGIHQRKSTQREVMNAVRNHIEQLFPNYVVFAQDLSLSGFSASRGFPLEFTVQGSDPSILAQSTKQLMSQIKADGIVSDLNSDSREGMPEVQIHPDRYLMAQHGVSVSTIGAELGTLIGGQIFSSGTQYSKDGHRYDIRIRSIPEEHDEVEDLNHVLIRTNRGTSGELVPLKDLVHMETKSELQMISRQNRERAIPVFANVATGHSQQEALKSIKDWGQKILPAGYHLSFTGSAETFQQSFEGLIFALLLGIAVSYMVLASQFNSFIHPITVLLALPFSLSGAFLALFICGQSLNLFSMIGLILLMGIVKKNSILLVDFTQKIRARGVVPREALLEACPVRLRPILMTSVATIVGALPAALSLGPGSETRIPMALTIIGGVSVSTFLTLFVVPCAYLLFVSLEKSD